MRKYRPTALTPVEKRLVRSVRSGTVLDLIDDEATTRHRTELHPVRATVLRDLLRGKLIDDPDPLGIQLRGARIEGQLDLTNVASDVQLALLACYLPDGIDGSLASLRSLYLQDCRIERGVDLFGAHIRGVFDASGTTLTNPSGPALIADGLTVDEDVFLPDGFAATGHGMDGALRLAGARIGGQLDATGAKLINKSGPALNADRLTVDQSVFLRSPFTATGDGENGALRLIGARIGGQLDVSGATLANPSGPALIASGLTVGQDLVLRQQFSATGNDEDGALELLGARIGGVIDASGAQLTNHSGPALSADGLTIDQDLILRGDFIATGTGKDGALRLAGVRVGGRVNLDPSRVKNPAGGPGLLVLDGLVYSGLPVGVTVAQWLEMLARQTTEYAAQPYRQLAAAAQAAGHDSDTRKILIAQRRDQLKRRAVTARAERAWAKLTGLVLGYGYKPWRALLFLLGVVGLALALTLIGASQGGLTPTDRSPTAATACSTVEQIGVALDLSLPLIKTGAGDTCTTTTTTAGHIIVTVGWLLQLAAWAFATLFIAGFTGAVRKT